MDAATSHHCGYFCCALIYLVIILGFANDLNALIEEAIATLLVWKTVGVGFCHVVVVCCRRSAIGVFGANPKNDHPTARLPCRDTAKTH